MVSERQASISPSDSIALDGCRIERALGGRVEIVEAKPGNRSFPDRVSDSLGICLKRGPDHEVKSDGRTPYVQA
jgi:hypothetical protein